MAETTYDGDGVSPGQKPVSEGGGGGEGERANERQHIQAPPTLLPSVLHRLGLSAESRREGEVAEITVEDVIADLHSDDWQLRIAAVRRLGMLEQQVPVELLEGALEDEDSSVRATAVRVLGCAGKRAPLPRLVSALHDKDWHVRETAILVLSGWRQDVPSVELDQALYDEDAWVRQAARLALETDGVEESTSTSYGRLWEQKRMQQQRPQSPFHYKGSGDPFETSYYSAEAAEQEYAAQGSGGQAYAIHEQEQAYAAHQGVYEHGEPTSARAEKVTSLPSPRSPRGWWIMVAATALVFFLLGSFTTHMIESPHMPPLPISKRIEIPRAEFDKNFGPGYAQYALMVQNEVSQSLKLSPDAIRGQFRQGRHLTDIAAAQGVSEADLHAIEMQAVTDAVNAALKDDQKQASKIITQLKENPQAVDKMVTAAFLVAR